MFSLVQFPAEATTQMFFIPQMHTSVWSLYKIERQSFTLRGFTLGIISVGWWVTCEGSRGLGQGWAHEEGVSQGDTLSVNTLIDCERGEETGKMSTTTVFQMMHWIHFAKMFIFQQ